MEHSHNGQGERPLEKQTEISAELRLIEAVLAPPLNAARRPKRLAKYSPLSLLPTSTPHHLLLFLSASFLFCMMIATGYSSLFSLGLSSIRTSFPFSSDAVHSPQPPSAQTPSTPASAAQSTSYMLSPPPKIHIDTQFPPPRPRLRRRRSSITVANSPCGAVKSPGRAASASFSKSVFRSPSKGRAALALHRCSDSDMAQGFIQRLRSNSAGDALHRSRRSHVRKSAPAPPDMPLPAVPAKDHSPPDAQAYRRILSDIDSSLNSTRLSLPTPQSATSFSSPQMLLTPGFASKLANALATSPDSVQESPVDPMMAGRSYFEAFTPVDEVMRET
ncbi:hypothetical protein EW145_g3032 [Phellinidium pouzarii]|uniref:Transmembrane protein n=1 Tax=Phellinidium pouzarii TaxID=167371 RepID=A0A4V3XD14_9AGAM|nr:hypothetical protein EW145_g3032 [Phellinidium pouzarii]